jgi:hypothetical protein
VYDRRAAALLEIEAPLALTLDLTAAGSALDPRSAAPPGLRAL